MAESLGEAVLDLTADDSALQSTLRDAARTAESSMASLGKSMSATGSALTQGITVPLAAVGAGALKASIDFESAFAGVRKTVDATEEEFSVLEQGIRDMAKELPASREEIAGVAEAAGQLGIQKENILSFTRTMVDLGETTNLTSQQAADALARLANITQMPQDQFDRLGSTIVALGNKSAATESEITEMALRIAGAGEQVGLTEAEIVGFAAALSSVGIEAQAGGTAISRVMIEIANAVAGGGAKLESFATVAGMSADEFKQSFETDAAGAIVTFIEGLGRMSESGQNVFPVLEELGLSEIRVRDALLRASNAGDLFRESIENGNIAWRENTALTNEAEQRYRTAAAQLEVFWNRITDTAVTLGKSLVPALLDTVSSFGPLLGILGEGAQLFAAMPPELQQIVFTMGAMAAAAGPVMFGLGKVITALGSLRSGTALAFGALGLALAGLDVAVKKFTGGGIMENLFGDVQRAEAAEQAVAEFQSRMNELGDDADAVKVSLDILNDVMGEMTQAQTGLAEALGGPSGSTVNLERLADKVPAAGKAFKEWEERVRVAGQEMVANGATAAELTEVYNKLPEPVRELFAETVNLTGAQEAAAEAAQEVVSAFGQRVIDSLTRSADATSDLGTASTTAVGQFREFLGGLEDADDVAKSLDEALQRITQRMNEMNPAVVANNLQIALNNERIAELSAMYGDQIPADVQATIDALSAQNEQLQRVNDTYATEAEVIRRVTDALWLQLGATTDAKGGIEAFTGVLLDNGRTGDQVVDIMSNLQFALNTMDPSQALARLGELKLFLSPQEWTELAAAIGPSIISNITQGVGDPAAQAQLLGVARSLGLDTGAEVAGGATEAVKGQEGAAQAAGTSFFARLVDGMLTNLTGAQSAGTQTADGALGAVSAKDGQATTTGTTLFARVVDGMLSNLSGAQSAGTQTADGALGAVSSQDGEASSVGTSFFGQLVDGMLSNLGDAQAAGSDVASGSLGSVSAQEGAASGAGQSLFQRLVDGMRVLIEEAASAGHEAASAAANATRGLEGTAFSAGQSLVQGLINGISSKIGEVQAAANSVAAAAATAVNALWIIRSPSKLATDMGEMFGTGLALGIENTEGDTSDAAADAAKAIVDGFYVGLRDGTPGTIEQMQEFTNKLIIKLRQGLDPIEADQMAHDLLEALVTATTEGTPQAVGAFRDLVIKVNEEMTKGAEEARKAWEQALEDLTQTIKDQVMEAADAAREASSQLADAMADFLPSITEAEDRATQKVRDAAKAQADALKEQAQAAKDAGLATADALMAQADAAAAAADEAVPSIRQIYEEWRAELQKTLEFNKNFEANLRAIYRQLTAANADLADATLRAIAQQGPQAAAMWKEFLVENPQAAMDIATAVLPQEGEALADSIIMGFERKVDSALNGARDYGGQFTDAFAQGLAAGDEGAIDAMSQVLADVILQLRNAYGPMNDQGERLIEAFERAVVERTPAALDAFGDLLAEARSKLATGSQEAGAAVATGFADGLQQASPASSEAIISHTEGLIRDYQLSIANLEQILETTSSETARAAIQATIDGYQGNIDQLKLVVDEAMRGLVDQTGTTVAEASKAVPGTIAEGMAANQGAATSGAQTVGQAIGDALTEPVAKASQDIGKTIVNGIAVGADELGQPFWDLLRNELKHTIEGVLTDETSQVKDLSEKMGVELVAGFGRGTNEMSQGKWSSITSTIRGTIQQTGQQLTQVATQAGQNIGMGMMQGMARGIEQGTGMLAAAARRAVQQAIQAMQQEAQVSSPSKVTTGIGRQLIEGLVRGIEASGNKAVGVLKDLASQMMSMLGQILSPLGLSADDLIAQFRSAAERWQDGGMPGMGGVRGGGNTTNYGPVTVQVRTAAEAGDLAVLLGSL